MSESNDDTKDTTDATANGGANEIVDEKAKEKSLRMAPAITPDGPTLTSSVRTTTTTSVNSTPSVSSTSASRASNSSSKHRGSSSSLAVGGSAMNMAGERNPLRYSAEKSRKRRGQAATTDGEEEEAATPGAVRVGADRDIEEGADAEEDAISLAEEGKTDHLNLNHPLMAEAVPEDDDDHIRKLEADNEALRRRVEEALHNEQRALQHVQTIVHTQPTADVAVAVEHGNNTENHRKDPSRNRSDSANCFKCCKFSVTVVGCVCICCMILVIAGATVGAVLGLDANDSDPPASLVSVNRRAYLSVLLRKLEPLEPKAFNWLVNVDTWEPPSIGDEDQAMWEEYLNRWFDSEIPASTADERKDWMWIERYVLASLYYNTTGTDWTTSTGWLTNTSHCGDLFEQSGGWYGISCQDDHIISIELEMNNLQGRLPKDMDAVNNMESLWIGDSNLTGPIPRMPANLTMCWLFNNELTGPIPTHLTELNYLTSLRLYENRLTGTIPPEIINLSRLEVLELVGNQMTGYIPELPTSLVSCDLSTNEFVETTNGTARGCIVVDQNPTL